MNSMHNPKIRRRRKKRHERQHQHPQANSAPHSNSTLQRGLQLAAGDSSYMNPHLNVEKPKVSKTFKRHEQEVRDALSARQTEVAETASMMGDQKSPTASQRLQLELDFFTSSIELSDLLSSTLVGSSTVDALSAETDGPQLASRTDDKTTTTEPSGSDAQQMVSSFVQIEDDDLVIPWRKERVQTPDASIFVNKRLSDDPDLVVARTLIDDGIFVNERPKHITEAAEQFLIKQILRTGRRDGVEKLNGKQQLIGLCEFTDSSASTTLKSVASKKFTVVRFEPQPYASQSNVKLRTEEKQQQGELNLFVSCIDYDHLDGNGIDEEHRIAKQITDYYAQYLALHQSNNIVQLEKKLENIRQTLLQFEKSNRNSAAVEVPQRRNNQTIRWNLNQLRCDRRDLRNRIHREHQTNRDLLLNILENWARLKEVRQAKGFAETSVKLVIRTNERDEADDLHNWDTDFNCELNEVLEEALQFYSNASAGSPSSERGKPDPYAIEDMLHDIYVRSRRHPGEPIVWLELDKLDSTVVKLGTSAEVLRVYVVQVEFDGSKKSMQRTVTCAGCKIGINAEIKMSAAYVEQGYCKLKMFEKSKNLHFAKHRSVIELFVPLPGPDELYANIPWTYINFTCSQNSASGRVRLKCGWTEAISLIDQYHTTQSSTSSSKGTPKTEEQKKAVRTWLDDGTLDPMDPEAASLVADVYIRPGETANADQQSRVKSLRSEPFRLNEDLTAFCSRETITQDKRLNRLRARFGAQLQWKDEKFIPVSERELTDDADDADDDDRIGKRSQGPRRIIEDLHWMDPIDVQRHAGRKHLLHVYRTIVNHCEVLARSAKAQDQLIGDEVPTFGTFFAALRQLFLPKRPLNPQKCRSSTAILLPTVPRGVHFNGARQSTSCYKMIVNVIRAHGVPFRESIIPTAPVPDAGRRGSTLSQNLVHRVPVVMPYVVASFREKSVRTCTAEGSNPTWNEQLIIQVNGMPNAYTIKDTLNVQLFDEIVEDLLDGDGVRNRANEIYQRISSRWLGEVRIPFYTLLAERRVEGTFEMTTSQLVLGYAKPSFPESASMAGRQPEVRNSVHLTLFVHIEPSIDMAELNTTNLESTELPAIVERIGKWLTEFREEFPRRCFDPLVTLSNGKRICVTRLIGTIGVPFERSNVTELLVRRFASLIPIVRNGAQCSRLNGVWLTNDETLSILCASAKDAGTLLASYYIALGFRAYLVLGFAVPHGDTAFVLTKQNGELFLVDPTTGRKYRTHDTLCPLVRVFAIVSPDNVWANVQREQRVFMMRFDVTRSAEWRPLFGRACVAPSGVAHDAAFAYRDCDSVYDLQKIIEWKVMKKIAAWRPHRKTTWNRHLAEALARILVELEENVSYGFESKANAYAAGQLADISRLYTIAGTPLNMPYVSLSSIVDRLRATGIHLNADGRVEFSVAVLIHPYPNNVLSVWVFVVTLVPKGS